jgi:hypothetical protein
MSIYSATVTNFTNGVVTIASTDTTPYSEIQASMGSINYGLTEMYIYTNSTEQLLEPLIYRNYNVNGNIDKFLDTPTVDPYQFQNSLYLKPIRDNIVFNGNTNLTFDILANQNVKFVMYVEELANSMLLKEPSFFQDYFFKQQYDFFSGFKDKI